MLKALRWPPGSPKPNFQTVSTDYLQSGKKFLEYIFPCLDLARLAFLNSSMSNDVLSDDVDCVNLLELIIVHLKDKSSHVNQVYMKNNF